MIPYKLNYAYLRRDTTPATKYSVSYDSSECELTGPDEIKENKSITITISDVSEGYIITENSISVSNADYEWNGTNKITVSNPTDDVYVECYAEEVSDAPDVSVDGDILAIVESEYVKQPVNYYVIEWTDQDEHTGNFSLEPGVLTCDLTEKLEPNYYDLEVYGVYTIIPYTTTESAYTEWEGTPTGTHTITYVAQNCTITGPEEVEDGEDFWVDAEADEGYHFEYEPDIDGEYDDVSGSIVDCGEILVYGCHGDLTITIVANPD